MFVEARCHVQKPLLFKIPTGKSVNREEVALCGNVEERIVRTTFRYPREVMISLVVFAIRRELVSQVVPPFVIPGWEHIFRALAGLDYWFVAVTLLRPLQSGTCLRCAP
jgi:hypothetical protein